MLHLKVRSVEERRMTFWEVVFRETVGRFLSSVLYVGYIMIGVNKSKRGLHDFLSDTEVIYYHEEKEYVDVEFVVTEEYEMSDETPDITSGDIVEGVMEE